MKSKSYLMAAKLDNNMKMGKRARQMPAQEVMKAQPAAPSPVVGMQEQPATPFAGIKPAKSADILKANKLTAPKPKPQLEGEVSLGPTDVQQKEVYSPIRSYLRKKGK